MITSRRQYIDLVSQLYKKSSEKKLLIASYEFWPIVRIQLSYICHLQIVGKNFIESTQNIKPDFSLSKKLSLIQEQFRFWLLRKKFNSILKDKVLLVGFNNHNSESGINPYIHPIKKLLDDDNIENEILLLRNNNEKVEGDLSYLFTRINSFYFNVFHSKKNARINSLRSKLASEIKENFSFIDFDSKLIDRICNTVAYECIQMLILKRVFSKFLKITKPKIVWTYCYYDNRILSMTFAGNKLKIPIIEYQHSMQGNDHFAYSKWENIDMLKDYFPSIFWVWRKSDEDLIRKNFVGKFYKPSIIVGGNIYLAVVKYLHPQLNINSAKPIGILVSLQGLWIPPYIEEAIQNFPLIKWYFRLHPRYPNDKTELDNLKQKFPERVETKEANELTLYQLFKKVKYNLTSFSGTAIEAYAFGIINIIFSSEGKLAYKTMIENKAFLSANNYTELEEILNMDNIDVNFNYDQIQTDISLIKKGLNIITNR